MGRQAPKVPEQTGQRLAGQADGCSSVSIRSPDRFPIGNDFSEREVWVLLGRSKGWGEIADALFRPSGLSGNIRGVTQKMAGQILRVCAGGMPPRDGWAL